MAPLEWLTPEKVMAFFERFGGVVYVVLGVASLYVGLTSPSPSVFLGFDTFVWLGIVWILLGVYWWFSPDVRRRFSEDR